MEPTWQYAASPINWCNDDLTDLGDHYSVEQILSEMHHLGFRGTELGRKFPRTALQLRPLLEEYGLQLASGWFQIHLAQKSRWEFELGAFERHVKFLQEMGARVVVTAEGSGSVHWDTDGDRPQKTFWSDADWQNVAAGLNRAGQLCADYGMRLAYHPHLGTNVESQSEISRLMETTESALVGLVVDTGHLSAAGVDPSWTIHEFRDRIWHVHMKSVRAPLVKAYHAGKSFLDSVRDGIFTTPGDGVLNFSPIMDALEEINYTGWCVIEAEQDPAIAEPVAYMRRALEYLSNPLRA